MSELLFSSISLTTPPSSCEESPPSGLREDPCQLTIPFTELDRPGEAARQIRFDRHGDQFVLSRSNSADLRDWFEAHDHLDELYGTLRLFNGLLRNPAMSLTSASAHSLYLISQYIMTGEVQEASDGTVLTYDTMQLGRGFLEIFADTREDVLSPLLGQLQLMRRASWLSAEALERARWVTSIVDLVPQYRAFRRHFVSDAELEHYEQIPTGRRDDLSRVIGFGAQIVVGNGLHRPLRFDQSFIEASDAYQRLYQAEIDSGSREDFCSSLETALGELRGLRGGTETTFLLECRQALELRGVSPDEAYLQSLRHSLLSEAGLQAMQGEVAEESRQESMTVPSLAERGDQASGGRIGEVLESVFRHLSAAIPSEGSGDPVLTLDTASLRTELTTLLDQHSSDRREYILACLAVFRLLASEAVPPGLRVFVRDNFQALSISGDARSGFRDIVSMVEHRLERRQEPDDLFLPIVEGLSCAIGITGLVLSETVPELRSDSGLRLGIGASGAGLGGGGCTALLGHFVWPEITRERDPYLWDGLTGLAGAILGVGIYFLAQFLGGVNGPRDPGTRYGVDPYGP